MSERLRKAYEQKQEKELRRAVNDLPWNKGHLARMRASGKKFNKQRQLEKELRLPKFSLTKVNEVANGEGTA